MGIPKKNNIKKHLPLTDTKTLIYRRYELVDKIKQDGTYLPKSLLHADLDKGFLDFVKNDLKTVIEGKVIPMVDILITTQNWSQFVETWDIQNLDKNVEPPFITVVRIPEVKYGSNPSTVYNIPNRKQYFYAQVPTWDGQRNGMDIYKIPQPVPVDIQYQVKIVCNRMRELNKFNQIFLEKFASRQAYTNIKGHYIPMINSNISDESVSELEKRKYYVQSYDITMMGFLIDEDEFEVSPAITRLVQMFEVDINKSRKQNKINSNPTTTDVNARFIIGNTVLSQLFDYTTNLIVDELDNISSYDVYINNQFYGSDITEIQINTNDVLRIEVVKTDSNIESVIKFVSNLL